VNNCLFSPKTVFLSIDSIQTLEVECPIAPWHYAKILRYAQNKVYQKAPLWIWVHHNNFCLIDGWHRLMAAKLNHETHVKVVFPTTRPILRRVLGLTRWFPHIEQISLENTIYKRGLI
jgi:hypothetical protein